MKLPNASPLLFLAGIADDVAVPEQAAVQQYNVLNFLDGSSPYFQFDGFGISPDTPETCTVEQVQLVSRHGERFPTANKAAKLLDILDKLQAQQLNGSLAFIHDYEWFVPDESLYDQETTLQNTNSVFAGSVSAERNGKTFRDRYGYLYDPTTKLPVFTSNSERVYDTSRNFIKGFLNGTDESEVVFNIIEESNSTLNNLTPAKACAKFDEDDWDTPDDLKKYATGFISRMQAGDNPNLDLKKGDVKLLFEMCAYEINVRGESPFCGIFNTEEYIRYEYYADVKSYYTYGPGGKYSKAIGSVMLNASLRLLSEDNDNKVWLTFTHNEDMVNYLAAIGLFTDKQDLSLKEVQFNRKYKKAKFVPQSARVILEKLNCGGENYVRFIVNDAVIPMDCSYGPGFSCALDDYIKITKDAAKSDFNKVCGSDVSKQDDAISFYWDYTSVTYNATVVPKPGA